MHNDRVFPFLFLSKKQFMKSMILVAEAAAFRSLPEREARRHPPDRTAEAYGQPRSKAEAGTFGFRVFPTNNMGELVI